MDKLFKMINVLLQPTLIYIFTVFASSVVLCDNGHSTLWYLGCFDQASLKLNSSLYEAPAGNVPSPAVCSKTCLDEKYPIAALSSQQCFCSGLSEALLVAELRNGSNAVGGEDDASRGQNSPQCDFCGNKPAAPSEAPPQNCLRVSGALQCPNRLSGSLCLPIGGEQGGLAVYRTRGPYIHNISCAAVAETVQTGKPFLLEVSGYLATPRWQPTGIQGLGAENTSAVVVVIGWTPGGQSIHSVTALENGFFTLSPDWILAIPGTYRINVTVSNSVSRQWASLQVTAVLPRPEGLEVTVLQEPQDIPSCVPFTVQDSDDLVKVFLGDVLTFQALVVRGVGLDFSWHFSDDGRSRHTGTDCHPPSDCLASSVSHTFEEAGIHTASVNVSNTYGWNHQTIHIAVIPRVLGNLTLESRSGEVFTVGQSCFLELVLFTTVRQLLMLNVSLGADGGQVRSLAGDDPGSLQLLRTYGSPSCLLHVRLVSRLAAAGTFPVSATVSSPGSVGSVALSRPLQVYAPISVLHPEPLWNSVISSGSNRTFSVVSPADRTGSSVRWTVSRGDVAVVNQTTEEWSIVLCLQYAGQYFVSVTAFNPISSASFLSQLLVQDAISDFSVHALSPKYVQTGSPVMVRAAVAGGTNVTYLWRFGTNSSLATDSDTVSHAFSKPGTYSVSVTSENRMSRILGDPLEFVVQDPVGTLAVRTPSPVTVKRKVAMSLAVAAGSDLAVAVTANGSLVYSNNGYVAGAELMVPLVFLRMGTVQITITARNQVSSRNSSVSLLVVPELHLATVELPQPAMVGEQIILTVKVNGQLWSNRNYLYTWNLPHNRTISTGSPVVSMSCDEPGSHPVDVTVTDHASSILAGTLLNVTMLGAAPSMSHPATTPTGAPVHFLIKNAPHDGSLDVELGDGNGATALYSSGVNGFVFDHTYTETGLYHIRVVSGGKEMLSSIIDVQEPVDGVHLTGPEAFPLLASLPKPSTVTWTVKVSRGSNYIYRWSIFDGKENVTFKGSDQFTMEVSGPAQLSIEVSVVNEISWLTANITTRIQYPITGVSLTAARVPLGRASCVVLRVAPPQDYHLSLDLGDGERVVSSRVALPSRTDCSLGPLCTRVFTYCHTYTNTGLFGLSVNVSSALDVVTATAAAAVEEPISGLLLTLATPPVICSSDFINATGSVQTGSDVVFQWQVSLPDYSTYTHTDRNASVSSLVYQAHNPGPYIVSLMISSPLYDRPFGRQLPVKVCGPIGRVLVHFPFGMDCAVLSVRPDGSHATRALEFRAHAPAEDADFAFAFGDGTPVLRVKGSASGSPPGATASAFHRFTGEGTFFIRVTAYNEFYSADDTRGPFCVEKAPANLQLHLNSSVVNKNEAVLFNASLASGTNVTYIWNMGDQTTYVNEGPEVCHQFLVAGVYHVSVAAQNRVGTSSASVAVSVLRQTQPIRIHTDRQAYPTDTDVTFRVVTHEPGPLELLWHFGDRPPARTTSRIFTRQYRFPNRYNVVVSAWNGLSSYTSDIYSVIIQSAVQPNRLLLSASVLRGASVGFDCRINAGTNVTYAWNFGDGTYRMGKNTERHVFHRTGEYTVEVKILNLVSSAILTGQVFVVNQPCQPPPVKNMGPGKIQVRRHQTLRLGVTYEAPIQCNVSQGLLYSWAVYESSGSPVQFPTVETHRQSIQLPNNVLHYGTYKAIARVQIRGSIVYSNYTVHLEVVPSAPISFIYGGTNLFISRCNSSVITLDGRRSYDPDYPQNTLSYRWSCQPLSGVESSCFDEFVPESAPVVAFPAALLKPNFDQFVFTLTVQSGDRSSSSEAFVTITPNLIRKVQVHCEECQGNTVNWNEPFSVQAQCESYETSPRDVSYTWKLYLVNGSSKVVVDVPFCNSVDMIIPSRLVESPASAPPVVTTSGDLLPRPVTPAPSLASSSSFLTSNAGPTGFPSPFPLFPDPFPEESLSLVGRPRPRSSLKATLGRTPRPGHTPDFAITPVPPGDFDIPIPPYYISEFPVSNGGSVLYREPVSEGDGLGGFPIDSGLPPVFESSYAGAYQDYDNYYIGIEEAPSEVSGSRPIGPGSSTSVEDAAPGSSDGEGNNLVDISSISLKAPRKTLLDLERELIDPTVFQAYTFTGTSSPIIKFKPFQLKTKTQYMLEVSASTQHTHLGKTQLFFSTSEMPQGIMCQVQPSRGYEIITDFSIFCTSGKRDLLYEYSFSTGNGQRKILYQGLDFQYYFSLPSGDPENDYKVTVYIKIQNRFGAATRPCPVNVTVLPSFQRNRSSDQNPDLELYLDGVRNLTDLIRVGNAAEVRNYVVLLTAVLNRLSQDPMASWDLQIGTRTALIAAVCQLTISYQETIIENISMLKELVSVTGQVTSESARMVTQHIRKISASSPGPSIPVTCFLGERTVRTLVLLLSGTLEVSAGLSEEGVQLTVDGLRATTDLLLRYVLSCNASQYDVSTGLMELKISQHRTFRNAVNSAGSTKFYLPETLVTHISRSSETATDPRRLCVISQLTSFRQDPYFWGKAPVQINGDVADLRLYNCTTREEIKVHSLRTPINIEFRQRAQNGSGAASFSLQRGQVNIHRFNLIPDNPQTGLQITVQFSRPASKPFPIMLLLRKFERPTPSLYNYKKVHRWETNTVHVFLRPTQLHDPGTSYLALLNADYDRPPRNKYVTSGVNYTLSIQSIQCLSWDGVREWKTDGCTLLLGQSSDYHNCSCNHLTTFAVAYQELRSRHDCGDVSQFISLLNNLMLCGAVAVSLVAYTLVVIVCKRADVRCGEHSGLVLLRDNSPLDQQLYAITIDTGLRSRAAMTAKVYIVLHGEEGVSQTRELNLPEKLLFERNSRHTVILSTSDSLGPIWKVHLWHNSDGHSPSWYLSHVVVKDLATGNSWFFPGECWLALDEGDGRVERELTPLTGGPGFRKLLYMRLTEYLEDFHLWASVYSCPSHSQFTRVQRASVCLLLLEGYMCVNAVLLSLQDDLHMAELGLIDVSGVTLATGVLSVLAVLPVGGLITLLFRLSKKTSNGDSSVDNRKTGAADYSVAANNDARLRVDSVLSSMPRHDLQQWVPETLWRERQGGVSEQHGPRPYPCQGGVSEQHWPRPYPCQGGVSEQHWPSMASVVHSEINKTREIQGEQDSSQGHSKSAGEDFQPSQVSDRWELGSRDTPLPSWCRHVAWAICLSLSLVCVVLTGVLGMKFSTARSLGWIQALVFSLLCCVFALHPALILISATVVALLYRRRCDFHSTSHGTEAAGEMMKPQSHNGGGLYVLRHYQQAQDHCTHFDKVLAARQRARYLRLARPPTPKELRGVGDQMRKLTVIHRTLREAVLHGAMLFLLLFVTYGKSPSSHYQLNQAVKTEFTSSRSERGPFLKIHTHANWWDWTLTTLLDGLYWDTWYNDISAQNKASAVRGTCILIGEPTLKKIEDANHIACKAPSPFKGVVPECPTAENPLETAPGRPESATRLTPVGGQCHCGHIGCYDGTWAQVGLGLTRNVAASRLQDLRDGGWLNRHTRAVMAQFTLFNPPSGLFTAVSLLAEQPAVGGLLSSVSVESVRVYQATHTLEYAVMACELLFLLFTLIRLFCLMGALSRKGLLAYRREAWNWLEAVITIISLLYYICYVYNFILAVEIIDHLQREPLQNFVDLSVISSWEQLNRSLHAGLVFLLLVKCILVLRKHRAMAPTVTLLRLSLSNLSYPMLAGVILVVALSCLGNLLFQSTSYPFSSMARSFQTAMAHCIGVRQPGTLPRLHQPFAAAYYSSAFCMVGTVWMAMIIGVFTSLVIAMKKTSRQKDLVTFSEMAAYVKENFLMFLGKHKQEHSRIHNQAQKTNFYLDEFEDLVDELLSRLSTLSNSLHQTLPNKGQDLGDDLSLLTSPSDCTPSSSPKVGFPASPLLSD